ncbi:hypothetical protein CVIRNUC_011235 [Coccomyxa viridis]|uniref:Uncharacterized protein n=1 Tax=Coccomyxa viridis TaxID=1274662 RepID=A0AAV1IKZ9_9CHLO|nr:hypothetical protein CVIRNUC_011235 [Coccomyxa viridis]
MAVVQEMAFADLFEAAILEESMSLDSMDEASAASTSINLLSLGPKTSVGCGLTRQFSTGPDVSELHALEPVGLPDEAWQRLYERIAQQRGPAESCGSSQMLKKGNEDLLQIFMSGAPEPGSVQQVASYLGQSEGNGASSKLRGAATTCAGALAC